TDSPGSQPPSIWLKGEKCRQLSWQIKPMDVDSNRPLSIGLKWERNRAMSPCIEIEDGNQKTPRDPVGMLDSDTHHPNEPTEPLDKKKGDNGEVARVC
ncbi:hypothetical protein PAXRUDRAFT_170790, partial [Paxillus rubicundulus Ve08.2h10]